MYLRKYWPDGSQFNRRVPNRTQGNDLLLEINHAILHGTWPDLKKKLARGAEYVSGNISLRDFSHNNYIPNYCQKRNRRPEFKVQTMGKIEEILGDVPVRAIRKSHADLLIRRSAGLSPATINRRLAVLKNCLSYAKEIETIDANPLLGFRMLQVEETAIRVPSLEEVRILTNQTAYKNISVGAYCALLAETAIRKSEGLQLLWEDVRLKDRRLTIRHSKPGKVRYIPLTNYAIEWLMRCPRAINQKHVFLHPRTLKPIRDPRDPFEKARAEIDMGWAGFHTFRHFRITSWIQQGMDLRTVQGLAGHASITTTQRYAHYSDDHAMKMVQRIAALEEKSLEVKAAEEDQA